MKWKKDSKRIPRKLKKKVKAICGIYYSTLSPSGRIWYSIAQTDPKRHWRMILKTIKSKYEI